MKINIDKIGKVRFESKIDIAVATGDIEVVQDCINEGWEVNQIVEYDKYFKATPINLAIILNDYKMIEFLLSKKAKLDYKKEHAFLCAVRYCDIGMIRYVASLGVKLDSKDCAGLGAYDIAAMYYEDNRMERYKVLEELGLCAKDHAGQQLFDEVTKGVEGTRYLLEQGVDVNTYENVWLKDKWTPICQAIIFRKLDVVKLLIEYGADLGIESSLGRPYTIATMKNYRDIAEYIKGKEDPKLHSLESKMELASEYDMPEELVEYLNEEEPVLINSNTTGRVEFPVIKFLNMAEIYKYKVKRTEYIVLANDFASAAGLVLLWSKKKKVVYYDCTTEVYGEFGSWKKFWNDPFMYMEGVFTMEYEKL